MTWKYQVKLYTYARVTINGYNTLNNIENLNIFKMNN